MITHVEKFLSVIFRPSQVREIRAIDQSGRIMFGYFDNIKDATNACLQVNKTSSVYITLNPVNPALLARCCNKIKVAGKKDSTTSDKDIASLDYLLIDCDPIRPSGISSTNEEKQAALDVAQTIRIDLGEPVLMGDSGNGYHLIYRHNAKTSEQLREFLARMSKDYSTNKVDIDTKVFNPARISKVLGTWAIKGDNIPSRPHRQSCIFEVGENPTILDIPVLEEKMPVLISSIPSSFDVRQFLSQNNIVIKKEKAWKDATMLVLNECAFDPSHKNGEAGIILHPDGKLSYQCFHNSCQGKTWSDFRNAIGSPKSSMSTCKTCGNSITWSKENGRNVPLNPDGQRHFCNKHKEIATGEPRLSTIKAEKDIVSQQTMPEIVFPLWIYPPAIQTWLKEISESVSAPIDFAACALLAVVGSLLAKKTINIKPGWQERPNIYLALCGDTGQGKSPSLSAVMAPIMKFEAELLAQYQLDKKNYEISMDIYNSMPKGKRNPENKPEKPSQRTLLSTNATVESISRILLNNPGLILLKDELTGWIKSMNQYRGGKGDDTEFYLSCWSGSPAKVDRVKEDSLFIPHPCLSLVGGIVPENVHVLVPETRDGFVERILFCFPSPIKKQWADKQVDHSFAENMMRTFFNDREKEISCTVTEKALDQFKIMYEEVHAQIASIKDDSYLKGFLEKSIAYVGRFALILNWIWNGGDLVQEEIINAAIALVNYFKANNQKAHKELSSSKENKEINAIYEWAKRREIKTANIRLLVRAGLSGCKNAESTKKKLIDLVSMDLAKWITFEKEVEFLY